MDRRLPNPPSHQLQIFSLNYPLTSTISWSVNILSQQKVGVYKIYKQTFLFDDVAQLITLERVQRKATRFCPQNFNLTVSVTDILRELEWDTLEMRRRLPYKLSQSLVDIKTEKFVVPNSETRTRRSHVQNTPNQQGRFQVLFFPQIHYYANGILCLQTL